jgi:EAL domain-containing protein (putative c-di-GMP-specific phosphodiesterase class I)
MDETIVETPQPGCGACREAQPALDFTMAFQPVVDVVGRRIEAHEALVRGKAKESAGAILAQITAENRYYFDQSCRVTAIELASRLGIQQSLHINFLPNAVYSPAACIRRSLDAAAQTGMALDRITFEIIEHEELAELAHLQRIIKEYRKHGFKVALDDFGTGYSGLHRLAELEPDIIKLDRALVSECDRHAGRLAIISAMVELCAKLKIMLIAEGIETEAEAVTLARTGVRFMQGFHFSRPAFEALVPEEAITWPAL